MESILHSSTDGNLLHYFFPMFSNKCKMCLNLFGILKLELSYPFYYVGIASPLICAEYKREDCNLLVKCTSKCAFGYCLLSDDIQINELMDVVSVGARNFGSQLPLPSWEVRSPCASFAGHDATANNLFIPPVCFN